MANGYYKFKKNLKAIKATGISVAILRQLRQVYNLSLEVAMEMASKHQYIVKSYQSPSEIATRIGEREGMRQLSLL
jgi:hypothetical protein